VLAFGWIGVKVNFGATLYDTKMSTEILGRTPVDITVH
jgi:hypothetical protein